MDRAGDVGVALFEFLGDQPPLAREGIEALDGGREGGAVVLEALAGAREQLLQVGACFGVEAGEEFVEVADEGSA